MQHLAFPLADLHEDSVDPFLQLVKVPFNGSTPIWGVNYSSQFCHLANLLRVHSVTLSRSLVKMLSDTAFCTPLVTGLQLDLMALITTLWAWQLGWFAVHTTVHLSSLYFIILSEDVTRDSTESLVQVNINDTYCSPFLHQAAHITLSWGRQDLYFIDQFWLLPNTFSFLLCLQILLEMISNTTFPGTEVRPPALLFVESSFLPPLTIGTTFAFSQSSGTCHGCCHPSEINESGLTMTSARCLRTWECITCISSSVFWF